VIFRIALRNLRYQARRLSLIALAIAIGFSLVTLASGATKSLLVSFKEKASRYFAGHVTVIGYVDHEQGLSDPESLTAQIRASGLSLRAVAPRTVYYRSDAQLFFNGDSTPQRRLIGVDFDKEGSEFDSLPFASGSWRGMERGGGILISQSMAKRTGAKPGDQVTVFATTDSGQYSATSFVVRGVFMESSLFGLVAYLDRRDMNALEGKAKGFASEIAVYLTDIDLSESAANSLRASLRRDNDVYPYFATKDELFANLSGQGPRLAVVSLETYISQFKSSLDAIYYVSIFVLLVLICIIGVGFLSSYRVVVDERSREIGTMLALGTSRSDVYGMFAIEAIALVALSAVAGLAIGQALLALATRFDLGFIPGSALFLDSGRLRFAVDLRAAALNYVLMSAVGALAACLPVRRALKAGVAGTLRED
jgi:putative ABC transport system permease protein